MIAAVLLLAVLFTPIPGGAYRDGGTKAYTALTYKIVDWNRQTADSVYDATKLYWFPENFKSVDELWENEAEETTHRFTATVLEIDSTNVLVQPVAGEEELRSADQFRIDLTDLGDIGAEIGTVVDIYYTGGIMESYPAQINAVKWEISGNLRHMNYSDQWLDQESAVKHDNDADHLVITEIYADCFLASPVIPMPYQYKLNGSLSEDWCVGDQVYCTFENSFRDEEYSRIEADLLTVEPSDFELDPNLCYKPVIYLYPEMETEVTPVPILPTTAAGR